MGVFKKTSLGLFFLVFVLSGMGMTAGSVSAQTSCWSNKTASGGPPGAPGKWVRKRVMRSNPMTTFMILGPLAVCTRAIAVCYPGTTGATIVPCSSAGGSVRRIMASCTSSPCSLASCTFIDLAPCGPPPDYSINASDGLPVELMNFSVK